MPLTAYIKPTNFCSIDCDHCYLTEEVRADKSTMTDETLRDTAKLLLDLAKREGHDSLHVIWHGGEPMMLNPDWYRNAVDVIDREIGAKKYTQSIQTSMIPYSSKWDSLIHERFDGFIGSSIDFTQRSISESSDAYQKAWLKKVNKAREAGIQIIPSMVPSRFEIGKGKQIVEWFEANEFPAFNIERYSDLTEDKSVQAPSNIHHSRFMIEIFDAVLDRLVEGKRVSHINVISAAINGVLFGMPGDRWGGACQREFVVVEPDGSLNTCPDRTSIEKPFSNVSEGTLAFMNSPDRRNWIRVQNISHKKSHCFECEFNTWCKSGCPITNNVLGDKEKDCAGYKTFLLHVKEAMSNEEHKNLLIEYARPLGEAITSEESLY